MTAGGHLPLVEQLYAAALSPRDWHGAVEALARYLEADHALLTHAAAVGEEDSFFASAGLDDDNIERFRSRQPQRPTRLPQGVPPDLYAPGRVISSADVLSDDDVERSVFYNEVIRPARGFYSLTSVGARTSDFHLSICRGRPSGAFEAEDTSRLQSLLQHIATALELHRRLRLGEQREAGHLALLDQLTDGVILCDGGPRPAFMNRQAIEILGQRDGLALGDLGLMAASPATTRKLRDAMAAMAMPGAERTRRVILERPSGGLPLVLSVLPVWRLGGEFGARRDARVAVIIQTPGTPAPVNPAVLSEIFGLTRRESDVVVRLAAGMGLPQIAQVLDLSLGTVRSHLKQVFGKTGVHSQSSLVALAHACNRVWE